MYRISVFVPKVTANDVEAARKDYPFLSDVFIPLVESPDDAANHAVTSENSKLPAQSCVSSVVSKVYNENLKGWDITMDILD